MTATSSRLVCRLAKWIVCRWVVDSISLYLINASLATGLADGGGRLAGGGGQIGKDFSIFADLDIGHTRAEELMSIKRHTLSYTDANDPISGTSPPRQAACSKPS